MTSTKTKLNKLFPIVGICALLIAVLIPSELHSQSTLTKITVNGAETTSPVTVKLAFPKQKAQMASVAVNYTISPGTIVVSPYGTELEFTSVNGNVVTIKPNSKVRLTAGPRGENYTNYNGTAGFNVARKMDFFNVTDSKGKVILASKSTAYSMSVAKNVVSFRTSSGAINVFKKVPLSIDEDSKDTKRNSKQSLSTYAISSQSDQDFNGESFDINQMGSEPFATYELAIDASLRLIQYFKQSPGFRLQLADEKSYLANLYLDDGRPADAIDLLEHAIEIYEDIDEYDPYVAEMSLDLAEAYLDSGYINEGETELDIAIDYLKEDLEFTALDFQESQAMGDEDLMWSDANALIDIYQNLSWAYELKGPDYAGDSRYYMNEAMSLSSRF